VTRRDGEQVYVVPRRELWPGRGPHGYVPLGAPARAAIYDRGFFKDRAQVEQDPTLKQIIPYALVCRGDEIFLVQRTRGGGERRLHGLRSVGIGGHVNPEDARDVVADGLARELHEELRIEGAWRARVVGLLNDDTTPVGAVHLGAVAVVELEEGSSARVREQDTMSGGFVGRADLLALHADERESFESWSALLLDRLDEVLDARATGGSLRSPVDDDQESKRRWPEPPDSSTPTPKGTPTSST